MPVGSPIRNAGSNRKDSGAILRLVTTETIFAAVSNLAARYYSQRAFITHLNPQNAPQANAINTVTALLGETVPGATVKPKVVHPNFK